MSKLPLGGAAAKKPPVGFKVPPKGGDAPTKPPPPAPLPPPDPGIIVLYRRLTGQFPPTIKQGLSAASNDVWRQLHTPQGKPLGTKRLIADAIARHLGPRGVKGKAHKPFIQYVLAELALAPHKGAGVPRGYGSWSELSSGGKPIKPLDPKVPVGGGQKSDEKSSPELTKLMLELQRDLQKLDKAPDADAFLRG